MDEHGIISLEDFVVVFGKKITGRQEKVCQEGINTGMTITVKKNVLEWAGR